MKTIRYTTVLLITMALGFYTVQAQSARRSDHREKREVSATKVNKREATPQKARTARTSAPVQKKEVQRQRTVQSAPNVRRTEVQRQRTMQPAPNVKRTEVQRQRATQPNRNVQRTDAQRQRTVQPAPNVQRQRTVQPAPNVQRQRTAGDAQKRTSISTPNNPRSTYRKADSKVYVDRNRTANTRVNKYSSKQYYGGHHYHYVYPKVRVTTHHHHDTYIHHYRVLYRPKYVNIYWTRNMYRDYRTWYPNYHWRYDYGYRIQTISIFDAKYNLGEVAAVYGRVYATWYNRETDDYLLFFGGDYPYQEFTVVLPAHVAKRFSWRPERYFLGQHIIVNGLITTFDGIPEIVVKHRRQVELY
ncbi:MAG TPA: hypothetical protein ENO20_06995 [Bacteroides sp.]|nr:hypothetical protein [Bacteroides sp.]